MGAKLVHSINACLLGYLSRAICPLHTAPTPFTTFSGLLSAWLVFCFNLDFTAIIVVITIDRSVKVAPFQFLWYPVITNLEARPLSAFSVLWMGLFCVEIEV